MHFVVLSVVSSSDCCAFGRPLLPPPMARKVATTYLEEGTDFRQPFIALDADGMFVAKLRIDRYLSTPLVFGKFVHNTARHVPVISVQCNSMNAP